MNNIQTPVVSQLAYQVTGLLIHSMMLIMLVICQCGAKVETNLSLSPKVNLLGVEICAY